MTGRVVLVRHGETEWSRRGRHTGTTDLPLTAAGEAAAAGVAGLLADVLAGSSPAAVYTSPLRRARRTADLAGLGAGAVVDPDLVEWNYGEQEGRTTAEIRQQRAGWTLWRDGVTGGETAAEVAVRADRVLARVRVVQGDVAIVAHGHLLRVLAARWLGCPPEYGRFLALSAAGVSVLGHEYATPVLERWNLTASIPGAADDGRDPTGY